MRTEKVVKPEESNLNMPIKSKKQFSKDELDELVIRLAEAHELI